MFKHWHVLLALTLGALLAGSMASARNRGDRNSGEARPFDHYLMSLSWSPSYCLTHREEADQCGSKGFGFILHGLWPETRTGSWLEHCRSDQAPDAATVERTLAFMPSRHLIEHEWQTHGTCTGLDPRSYFELADRAFASLAIPPALQAPRAAPALSADQLVRAFATANAGLDETMISVVCREGYELTEVRVCLNRETLKPEACTGHMRSSCRYGVLKIPALR